MPNIENLKKYKNIHMIGIGGVSMSGIAAILTNWGFKVTGSDWAQSEATDKLNSMGIKVTIGHNLEDVKKANVVVYSAAIKQDDPEMVEAKNLNIPTIERADFLGELTRCFKDTICISGTHGKTTTTSMISLCFLEALKDPSIQVGAFLNALDGNYKVGNSEHFIIEACEYVESFLKFSPKAEIILNIDNDHLDYFKNLDNIKKSFNKFAHQTSNLVVYNGDNANAEDALEDVNIKKITFGLSMENDYYATNMQRHGVTQSYDLMYQGEFLTKINLSVPGIHNVYNSLAAITVADYLGVPIKDIAENIAKFTGVHRRFELLGKPNGITVVDDFAHHPTELTSTLETAMELGFNHVWAVFQPHTFSRTALLMDDFAKALKIPDTAIISAILPVRETNTYNVYNTDLGKKVPGSVCLDTFDEITDYIVKNAKEGDLVLTMGGGNVYMCANQIVKALENK